MSIILKILEALSEHAFVGLLEKWLEPRLEPLVDAAGRFLVIHWDYLLMALPVTLLSAVIVRHRRKRQKVSLGSG